VTTGRAAVLVEPNRIETWDVPVVEPGPGEVLVSVVVGGVCGSDLHIKTGDAGVMPFQIILGHESIEPRELTTKFKDPERFDIFREDNNTDRAFRASADHISFADGRHFCGGNLLACEEVEIATNVILDNISGPPRFAEGFDARETGIWFRAPHELQLAFDPAPAGAPPLDDARFLASPKLKSRTS
jgi:hypothetical protein